MSTRAKKSKTLVLPGFIPVLKEVQAEYVIKGIVEVRFPWTPLFMRVFKVGSAPFSIHGVINEVFEFSDIVALLTMAEEEGSLEEDERERMYKVFEFSDI